jgi:hypothetical protein
VGTQTYALTEILVFDPLVITGAHERLDFDALRKYFQGGLRMRGNSER